MGEQNTDKNLKAAQAMERLRTAFAQNDFETFRSAYLAFLLKFPSFEKALSENDAGIEIKNPIFGEPVFYLRRTSGRDTEILSANAHEASRVLARLPVADRLRYLMLLQWKIAEHEDDIVLTISADTGKPVDLARSEMKKGNEWFAFAASEAARQLADKTKPHGQGVAQIIGAFNYPYALSIGGIVGALAAGCGVVVSAPAKAPGWAFAFAQAAQEAADEFASAALVIGKPWARDFAPIKDHLIQITAGVNRRLTKTADIVHFVGGDAIGKKIDRMRAGRRTILELGGSNVVIVMASAVAGSDEKAERIADTIYQGFAFAAGQRCTAPRILCVQSGAERVIAALKTRCAPGASKGDGGIGNPFEQGVRIGPLAGTGVYAEMKDAIAFARHLGAEVTGELDADVKAGAGKARWVNPVIIDWSRAELMDPRDIKAFYSLMGTEIFGPLLHVVRPVMNLDEAIMTTHMLDTHGLAGAIFTADPQDTKRYRAAVNVTFVTENVAPKDQSPYGPHGHPGRLTIGGSHHFQLYADSVTPAAQQPHEGDYSTL